jgi:hypothetical protein
MLVSTFSTMDSAKIKISLVAESAKSIGDICISYGPSNNIYLTWDEVIALVTQMDALITEEGKKYYIRSTA